VKLRGPELAKNSSSKPPDNRGFQSAGAPSPQGSVPLHCFGSPPISHTM